MKRVFEAIQVVAIITAVYLLSRGFFVIIAKDKWEVCDLLLLSFVTLVVGSVAKEIANGKNS